MPSLPPMRPSRPNRRTDARQPVDAPARLRQGQTVLEGKIENLSSRGAAFATGTMTPEFAVDARVTLVLPGAGDAGAELELPGRVVRTEEFSDGDGETRSYALEFDEPVDG